MTDGAGSSSSASSVHGAFSRSRKRFFEFFETIRDQIVLAVDSVLKAEVVEDSGKKLTTCRMIEAVRDLDICPVFVLGRDFVKVQVVNVQESTLFQIGKNNAPAATQIRKSAEEQIVLECLFVFSLDGC